MKLAILAISLILIFGSDAFPAKTKRRYSKQNEGESSSSTPVPTLPSFDPSTFDPTKVPEVSTPPSIISTPSTPPNPISVPSPPPPPIVSNGTTTEKPEESSEEEDDSSEEDIREGEGEDEPEQEENEDDYDDDEHFKHHEDEVSSEENDGRRSLRFPVSYFVPGYVTSKGEVLIPIDTVADANDYEIVQAPQLIPTKQARMELDDEEDSHPVRISSTKVIYEDENQKNKVEKAPVHSAFAGVKEPVGNNKAEPSKKGNKDKEEKSSEEVSEEEEEDESGNVSFGSSEEGDDDDEEPEQVEVEVKSKEVKAKEKVKVVKEKKPLQNVPARQPTGEDDENENRKFRYYAPMHHSSPPNRNYPYFYNNANEYFSRPPNPFYYRYW